MATTQDGRPLTDASLTALVQRAADQTSRLVRDELRLARTELTEKGRHAGTGFGLLGSGGVVALYGVAALAAAAILGLAEAVPGWLAALIVAAVLFVTAALLGVLGRGQVRRAVPPRPEEAVGRVRQDIAAVTSGARDRGRP